MNETLRTPKDNLKIASGLHILKDPGLGSCLGVVRKPKNKQKLSAVTERHKAANL